ncbi:MAG: aminotransferase class I/II-fold pyridoxal phosphate-dependent enzyme [Kofleriaceae bacterium]|nr:aminotransferase class I/II-fold pyridoxal phosphate-dependent enzyme [Kofleriaceae bacterium]
MRPETIAIHLPGIRREGALSPPIHLSTTYEFGGTDEGISEFDYIRDDNPNVADLETRLAALDCGEGAVTFASGMAAGTALLQTLPARAKVIFHRDLYSGFQKLVKNLFPQWNLVSEFADLRDSGALEKAITPEVELIWFETPSNPGLELVDIETIVRVAATVNARVVVDGTFATSALQQPLNWGADVVLHSATKYFGGHSDVQGGALIVRQDEELVESLRKVRSITGGVLSPFNAYMVSRGLMSLHCRIAKHCENALAIAHLLSQHPKISRVHYPFLPSNPDIALAKKQMSAGGGMVSMEVAGGREAALTVASRVKLFVNATSLGGVESLIQHRFSPERVGTIVPESMLRLSVGLEHIEDLKEDLLQALG